MTNKHKETNKHNEKPVEKPVEKLVEQVVEAPVRVADVSFLDDDNGVAAIEALDVLRQQLSEQRAEAQGVINNLENTIVELKESNDKLADALADARVAATEAHNIAANLQKSAPVLADMSVLQAYANEMKTVLAASDEDAWRKPRAVLMTEMRGCMNILQATFAEVEPASMEERAALLEKISTYASKIGLYAMKILETVGSLRE